MFRRVSLFVRQQLSPASSTASRSASNASKPRSRAVGIALFAIPIAATFGLGAWQLYRLQWKLKLISTVNKNVESPPAPIESLLEIKKEQLDREVYKPYSLTGFYDRTLEVRVGPRFVLPDGGQSGYWVVNPFQITQGPAQGQRVLVVRGWIPRDMSLPPPVPADHTPRTLTAFYRGGDEKKLFTPDNDPDTRTYYWLDAKELAEMGHAHPLVLVADAASTPPSGYPRGGQIKPQLRNDHLQYSITWFTLALFMAATGWKMFRRSPVRTTAPSAYGRPVQQQK